MTNWMETLGQRPQIMGILNITPDSFSGDGLASGGDYVSAAVEQAQRMAEDGADLLDIGGESTRPGFQPVSAEEEISRVVPVILALRQVLPAMPLSIDTFKAAVAEAALEAGAAIVNDISALDRDPDMAGLVAKRSVPVILMHNRSRDNDVKVDVKLGASYAAEPDSEDIVELVITDLRRSIDHALLAGIRRENIILDPGLGFGKTVQGNLRLLHELPRLRELGFPLLVGSSRKSFIGHVLGLPVEERLEGTAATVAIAAYHGADILRVHEVKAMARVAKMAGAIARA